MPSFKNPLKRKNKNKQQQEQQQQEQQQQQQQQSQPQSQSPITATTNGKRPLTAEELQELKDYERTKNMQHPRELFHDQADLNPRSRVETVITKDMTSTDADGKTVVTQTAREILDPKSHTDTETKHKPTTQLQPPTTKESAKASFKQTFIAHLHQHKHLVVPFSIIFATYICGLFGVGVLSLLTFCLIWAALTLRTKIMTQDPSYIITMPQKVAKAAQLQDADSVRYLLQHMPRWVEFSDLERANWLSTMLEIMWPSMKQATQDSILQSLTPIFDSVRPKWMKRLGFEVCDMGDSPPFISGVKHYYTAEENVTMDFNVKMAGNVNIIVVAEIGPVTLQVQVQHLVFEGDARVVLTGLIPSWPCFSGIDVSFVSKPFIDFSLTAAGIPLMNIPGLDMYITTFIRQQMANVLVWPAKLSVPLVVESPEARVARLARTPKGVLHVALVEARDLTNTDTFSSKSDPYARITVEHQERKTEVCNNTLNPKWKERFEFIVNQPDKEEVHIAISDWEKVGYGKSIGEVSIPISILLEKSYQDIWLPLNHAKSGVCRVQLEWNPFVDAHEDISNAVGLSQVLFVTLIKATGLEQANPNMLDKGLGTALDMVPGLGMVPGLNKLGFNDNGVYCTMTVGSQKHRSEKINDAQDPRWDQKFAFPIRTAALERLNVKLKGMSMGRSVQIGEFFVDLSDVMHTGRVKDAFSFAGGVPGKIHMQLELKTIRQSIRPPVPATPIVVPSILEITLHSARDLVAADSNGFSDPFVKFSLGSHKPVQSKTVSKTLNPDWGDAKFEFPVADAHNDALLVHVYDYDRFGSNDPLGDLFIAMSDLLGRGLITSEWPLSHTAHGTIKLSLQLKPTDPALNIPCTNCATVPSMFDPKWHQTTDTKLTNNRNIVTQFVPKTITSGVAKLIPGLKKDDKEKKHAPGTTASVNISTSTSTTSPSSTSPIDFARTASSVVAPSSASPAPSNSNATVTRPPSASSPPVPVSTSAPTSSVSASTISPDIPLRADGPRTDETEHGSGMRISVDMSDATGGGPRFHTESEVNLDDGKDGSLHTPRKTQTHSRDTSSAPGSGTASPALSRSPSVSRIGQVSMSRNSKAAPYQLSVTIHQAHQLSAPHHSNEGPTAYVKVRVGSRLQKTHRQKKTCDPVFEETFQFGVHDPSIDTIFFRVKDYHFMSSNHRIGEASIPVQKLCDAYENKLDHIPLELTLLDPNTQNIIKAGTIIVSAGLKQVTFT